jgi:hypothetical protein
MATKKDYELIAAAIRRAVDDRRNDVPTIWALSRDLAAEFAKENTAFNRAKFFKACNLFDIESVK